MVFGVADDLAVYLAESTKTAIRTSRVTSSNQSGQDGYAVELLSGWELG